ncbi:MAG: abhydrolase domain-containing 18 [Acidobacteria bacterium]|nr:abhydrolase domain-containing 18 [Acidobacteriota bacterium]
MSLYSLYIRRWEEKLATADTNRVVRKFDFGRKWLVMARAPHLFESVEDILRNSDEFFAYPGVRDYRLRRGELGFSSPVASPFPENNHVRAAFFPARGPKRAVVVLPQWNAGPDGHIGLCKLLNRFGITALRLTLAYHGVRRPPETARADYHLSSNLGRTIHAVRQSVIDARACLDWLESEGYERLGILGTSLGSCIAFLVTAHDARVRAGVFNHVALYVGDVVWTGLSTRHVRDSLREQLTQEDLRRCWSVISPGPYLERLRGRELESLLVWARHDSSFLPEYSRQVLAEFERLRLRHQVFCLPCGHYTSGRFPFNLMDGLAMSRFLAKKL